jgi:LuxR family maltose regulon positive regulatory protein
MVEILSTKLFIPRPRPGLVPRQPLTDRLNAGLKRKLTLIAAPAGFGKTSLLSEWIPQSPRCVTWLSLDEDDNDPTRFWTYVIASTQQIHPDLGDRALALLQSSQAPPITSIITSLINDISAFPDDVSTVLDDYHVISSQPIHEALTYLIDHLPVNFHLVITTRADPPLPLARLRAHDQLNEFRANDLRFTSDETAAFLNQVMGLNLSADEVAALERRTEGWIAGLQIAALSVQGHENVPGFLRAFSGSHRHILGYLADEVLDQRPEGTLSFLLQTSILDRLCGSLCDAVTGGSGGQGILEKLERTNLFISPLDDEGVWYRYHQLFAEVLQARLQRNQPECVPELHRRAGDWYARQGIIDEAVRHALAGGDFEEAACLIECAAGGMLRRGSSALLIRWLDAMSEETIRARPRLCLARGWVDFMGSALDLEGAEEWAQLALRVASADGSLDPGLSGEVAALQAMIAATRSEVELSLELSRMALDDLPPDSPWRSAVAFCLGTAYYLSGDMAAAAPVFEEAIRLSKADGEHFIQFASASFLAEILVFKGHLDRAMELYEQVLSWAVPALPQKGEIMAHGGLAGILYERDQHDAALAHIQLGADQLERVGGAWSGFVLYRVQARLHQAQGNWTDALDVLNLACQIGKRNKVSLVAMQSAALRAQLQLARGDLPAAIAWAAQSGLNPDDPEASHPGWREVEYLTLARVLAAQDRYKEALSLLGRLLHSAQTEERDRSAISILILQSLVLRAQDDTARALECLERALTLAEPEIYVRIFVDEGEAMRLLLAEMRVIIRQETSVIVDNSALRLLRYVDRLLSAFPKPTSFAIQGTANLLEPLSQREQEILQLISRGFTNEEIAVILVIALSTVKTHINNLYSKLGTHRRTQAVSIARDLGLLSN